MASPNVQVDIVVGKNTVVPALSATSAAMEQTARTSRALDFRMEGLSQNGLRKVEGGFRTLAFQAAGVSGPMGKVAEGALLLGGSSGVLLGVAVAAGTLAVAWQKLGAVSDEAKDAVARMNKELTKQSQAILDIAAADKEIERQRGRAGLFALFAEGGTSGILGAIAKHFNDVADGIERTTRAYTSLQAHGATDDFLIGFNKSHPMPTKTRAKEPKQADPSANLWLNQDFSQQSAALDLQKQLAALNAELLKVPLNMTAVDAVMQELDASFAAAADQVTSYFDAFTDAFMGLAEGLGAVAAGMANLGTVLSTALAQAISGAAKVMAKYELGQAAASFAAAIGPIPQPGMVAAGLKHLAAAAAFGVVAGLAGAAGAAGGSAGSSGRSRAVSGGLDKQKFGRDQGDLANRGTLTVTLPRNAIMRADDPSWQEFMAQTVKQGQGRNVVFNYV